MLTINNKISVAQIHHCTFIHFDPPCKTTYSYQNNLIYGCQDNVTIIWKFDINGISIISLWKDSFSERVFTSPLVYRKQAMSLDKFCRTLEYLLIATSVDVPAGGVNYALSLIIILYSLSKATYHKFFSNEYNIYLTRSRRILLFRVKISNA